jgi:hypothetical protein
MDRWVGGWMDGWMGRWIDRWVDRWMGGWMNGWKDGQMDEYMDRFYIVLIMPYIKRLKLISFHFLIYEKQYDTGPGHDPRGFIENSGGVDGFA